MAGSGRKGGLINELLAARWAGPPVSFTVWLTLEDDHSPGIAAFVATVNEGSISTASRRLGHAKSVVSDRLAEIERMLAVTLLQRSTFRLSLTFAGLAFLPRAQRILREVEEASVELGAASGKLAGTLPVSAPVGFAVLRLGPAVSRFLQDNAGIEMSLEFDDSFVDAASGGFDAVLRHGATEMAASSCAGLQQAFASWSPRPNILRLMARPLRRSIWKAVRASLYKLIGGPALRHGLQLVGRWPRAALRVNNGLVMREAALLGLGLATRPIGKSSDMHRTKPPMPR